VFFVAWGYIDTPGVSGGLRVGVGVLSLVVPALFLAGVAGIALVGGGRVGWLGWTGMGLALGGTVLGVVAGIFGGDLLWAYFSRRGWPAYLSGWMVPLLAGLTILGFGGARRRPLRGASAVALAMGASGWAYFLTDSWAVFEARVPHVGFGLLFSLGWVVLGIWQWTRGAGWPREPDCE
jgi:hypothetical protein